jgi:hypothetical protein
MRVMPNRLLPLAFGIGACLCLLSSRASAQYIVYDNLPAINPGPIADPNVRAANNAFSANLGGNVSTAIQGDDIKFNTLPPTASRTISKIEFYVSNLDVPVASGGAGATAISVRPRLRIWAGNRTAPIDGPGSLLGAFDLPIVNLAAPSPGRFSSELVTLDLDPFGGVSVPDNVGRFWIGVVFDNNNGATGMNVAQMNNVGLVLNRPISPAFSSDDLGWGDDAAAGAYNTSNPEGDFNNSADYGLPSDFPLNFAFRVTMYTVPEPGTGALLMMALLPAAVSVRKRYVRISRINRREKRGDA